jgi:C_GCAxxG_C_C family probable redox protein
MESKLKPASIPFSEPDLIQLIGRRAENLFSTGQMWCAETVLCTLNQGLQGGLPLHTARGLMSGFSQGLGGSGCMCGALNGAVAAVGLFLAGCDGAERLTEKKARQLCAGLHDQFKLQFGSACCRVLCRTGGDNAGQHHRRCASQTGFAAQAAARIILAQRPGLAKQADLAYLQKKDTRLRAGLRLCTDRLRGRSADA